MPGRRPCSLSGLARVKRRHREGAEQAGVQLYTVFPLVPLPLSGIKPLDHLLVRLDVETDVGVFDPAQEFAVADGRDAHGRKARVGGVPESLRSRDQALADIGFVEDIQAVFSSFTTSRH